MIARPTTAQELADALCEALDIPDTDNMVSLTIDIHAGRVPMIKIVRYVGHEQVSELRDVLARFKAGEVL